MSSALGLHIWERRRQRWSGRRARAGLPDRRCEFDLHYGKANNAIFEAKIFLHHHLSTELKAVEKPIRNLKRQIESQPAACVLAAQELLPGILGSGLSHLPRRGSLMPLIRTIPFSLNEGPLHIGIYNAHSSAEMWKISSCVGLL